jgi:hypothetical protein
LKRYARWQILSRKKRLLAVILTPSARRQGEREGSSVTVSESSELARKIDGFGKEDGIYTLDRFFPLLLSHLTFFLRRRSTPSFENILSENAKECTVVCAYPKQELVPVPSSNVRDVPVILLTAHDGTELGTLYDWGEQQ